MVADKYVNIKCVEAVQLVEVVPAQFTHGAKQRIAYGVQIVKSAQQLRFVKPAFATCVFALTVQQFAGGQFA